jgi:iron complex outermembrane receptor protein
LTKTGIVLDDIPQPTFSTLANELSDVERVEVLPGPQSTLSGRNAAGGLINIVTRSPTKTLTARLFAEQTSDRQTRMNGFVSGPLSTTLGASISGYYNKWDGPYRNVVDGKRLNGFEQQGVRAKLQWQPTADFSATLTGFYTKGSFDQAPIVSGGPYVVLASGAAFAFTPTSTLASLHPGAYVGPYSRDVSVKSYGHSENENRVAACVSITIPGLAQSARSAAIRSAINRASILWRVPDVWRLCGTRNQHQCEICHAGIRARPA